MTLRRFGLAAAAYCALAFPAHAQQPQPTAQAARSAPTEGEATSIDAPPTLLLFAMALGGIAVGRRMARNSRRKDDPDA